MLVQNQLPQCYVDSKVLNNKAENNQKQQNFNGALDVATNFMSGMESQPMLKVAFVDTTATNVPRTLVDLKTGIPAALETARREFSGLIVNCLIPSFFVLGIAKLLNKPMMGNLPNMSSSWADEKTLSKFAEIHKSLGDDKSAKNFVSKTFETLHGFKDNKYQAFSQFKDNENFKKAINKIAEAIDNPNMGKKETSKLAKEAFNLFVGETKAAETISFDGAKAFGSNLSDLIRDQIDVGRKFADKAVSGDIDGFVKKATKFVNAKSLLGLGVIIPLACSVQSINRAITRHKYKQKGAPIYSDFGKGDKQQPKEMTPVEKRKFFGQKCLSAASMFGLALLSMMKKPTLGMLQFKGMFPTTDQCRWIASSTFASRMFAAEDPNELRESTVRDLASFAGLYFLGDYAEKGAATLIESIAKKKGKDIKLINRLVADDKTKGMPKRFWNWVKNYKLKSFDEITNLGSKRMRAVSQLAGLAFSIISLGVVLPKWNRHVTNKKVAEAKAKESKQQQSSISTSSEFFASKIPSTFKGFSLQK